jgi:hypothetical protein
MAAGSDDQPLPEPVPNERYGIVALFRTHKDDGRSLILYSREDHADGASPEPAGDDESA